MIVRCGDVTLDFARYEAMRCGKPVHLRPKLFNLLAYLIGRRERIVSKQELFEQLWPDQIVGDSALDTSIKEARQLFGDTGCAQCVIKTVRGRGFRFAADIEVVSSVAKVAPSTDQAVRAARARGSDMVVSQSRRTEPSQIRLPSRFVGREKELATIVAKFDIAKSGRGQIVGIVGEPGIGKSRLLAEARARLPLARQRIGHCSPSNEDTSSRLVAGMLRECCGILAADDKQSIERKLLATLEEHSGAAAASEWGAFLLSLLGIETASELSRFGPRVLELRLSEALGKAILKPRDPRPLLVAVEDLHWIDSMSQAWLGWLERGITGLPVLLLATYRPGYCPAWIGRSCATQIALDPLTEAEARKLVEELSWGAGLSEVTVAAILCKAEGNPLFLEELAKGWREHDGECQPGELVRIPDSILTLLASGMSRLPDSAREVLGAASVIGAKVPLSLLRVVAGVADGPLRDQLSALVDEEYLLESFSSSEVVYAFKHTMIHDAAYQLLSEGARRAMHERAANALSEEYTDLGDLRPEQVARHFGQAGLDADFIRYWFRATEKAMKLPHMDTAVRHLMKGLDVLREIPDSAMKVQQELSLLVNLAGVLSIARGYDDTQAGAIVQRAEWLCERSPEGLQLLWALSGLVRYHFFCGNMKSACRMLERLHRCEQASDVEVKRVAKIIYPVYRAMVMFHMGRVEESLALAEPVHPRRDAGICENLTSVFLDDPEVLCSMYAGAASLLLGCPDRAHDRLLSAVALARCSAQPWSMVAAGCWSAYMHCLFADHATSASHAELAAAVCEEHGLQVYVNYARIVDGLRECATGAESGLEKVGEGLSAIKRKGCGLARTGLLASYAAALGCFGRVEEGLAALAEAESLFENTGERYAEPEVYRIKGELLLLKSPERADQAEALFRQALSTARMYRMRWWELRAASSLESAWQK